MSVEEHLGGAELAEQVAERASADDDGLLEEFARRYFGRAGTADLVGGRDADELLAEARGMLGLCRSRGRTPVAVRAFTPTRAEHGYECGGSVLETNTQDLPFLVDSVTAELGARGIELFRVHHPILGVVRDPAGAITDLGSPDAAPHESLMHIEFTRGLAPEMLAELEDVTRSILASVSVVVDDFPEMLRGVDRLKQIVAESVERNGTQEDDADEIDAFLDWMRDDNIIFLGYREERGGPDGLEPIAGTALGLLRPESDGGLGLDAELEIGTGGDDPRLLRILRSRAISPVHRREPMETVLVRRAGENGQPDGVVRLLGMLTTRAISEPASRTPQLRHKLRRILEAEQLVAGSHDSKAAIALFDGFPKAELLAAPVDDLRKMIGALLTAGPSQVRLVGRLARHGRAASLVASMPRDTLTAELRQRMRATIADTYRTSHVEVVEVLGEGGRVYVHVAVRAPRELPAVDIAELERTLQTEARTWSDRTADELVAAHGTERGRMLAARWLERFPETYRAGTEPVQAALDIAGLERLATSGSTLGVVLSEDRGGLATREICVTLLASGAKVDLSDATPMLEHHGLRVIEERPTRLLHTSGELWVQRFSVLPLPGIEIGELDAVQERLAESIAAVWNRDSESDSLNRLVLAAGLDWEQVQILRAFRRYRQRVGSRYTETFQNDVIVANGAITAQIMRLFEARFRLDREQDDEERLLAEIRERLDDVELLDHDRILRNQLGLICATVRTNVYNKKRGAMAFKVRSADVPAMPKPAPLFEIFVYARDLEGIHLRGGRIARGGLRWSDRMDYRTEVYGLMRAQMTKNAVIVPAGAKGGFFLKERPSDPAALRDAVRDAYIRYIESLLDVTDNLDPEDGSAIHPEGVRVHDEDDTYLVVAADKGTATFSDTANEIAVRRGFWLGDAFASGGSVGYDHKKLGITARGAWESVKRHFVELGSDPESDPVTAVGIGDMSGDVFGNGMLLSRSLRLIAAYDHRHIFIDPDPQDAERSWQERKRLFEMSGSSWADYDRELISAGGGVFPRSAKSVELTAEIRAALAIEDGEDRIDPSLLIRHLLRAPVDLLWNGGIGTVVKASHENDADAQDRASDQIRVDARDLRCKVVGEGGNLGFTQRARIEAADAGVLINADFIDNSAGVDSSDHEVNLKILLDLAVGKDLLSTDERNQLLADVTGDVVDHVLYNSYEQAQLLSHEAPMSADRLYAYTDLMEALEDAKMLDRASESLPDGEELGDRRRSGRGMARPELAVLVAYAKRLLTGELLESGLPDDSYFDADARAYFPPAIVERHGELISEHPLRRELISTLVANGVVNELGPTFVTNLARELGAAPEAVVRSYRIAREVTGAQRLWQEVERSDGLGHELETEIMRGVDDVVARVARWYLRHEPEAEIGAAIEGARGAFETLAGRMPELRSEAWRERTGERARVLADKGAPEELALLHASLPALQHTPDIVAAARETGRDVVEVAQALFTLGELLGLERLEDQVMSLPSDSRIQRWAQQALLDDLLDARRILSLQALREAPDESPGDAVSVFLESRTDARRRLATVARALTTEGRHGLAALTLAVRHLRGLAA